MGLQLLCGKHAASGLYHTTFFFRFHWLPVSGRMISSGQHTSASSFRYHDRVGGVWRLMGVTHTSGL
jgi:hypothetical protein